jgi:predicted  nucleic acid-binding Zn-ribbon protein
MAALEPLLSLQERDLAVDRIRHRIETLPERDQVADAEARRAACMSEAAVARELRDEVATRESRFDDEARLLSDQAMSAEARLYGGEVTSPRELQALQADIEQLKRRQRTIEDRQLAAMEEREPLETRLAELEATLESIDAELATARATLGAAEVALDAQLSDERSARDAIAVGIDDSLLSAYEERRAKASGVGAARLVGMMCQGCHLSIPASEVDRIRRAPAGTLEYCDNCGCILVL